MKIIKRGIVPKEQIFEVTCITCKSELEFAKGELTARGSQYNEAIYGITCPVCNADIYFYESELPKFEKKEGD